MMTRSIGHYDLAPLGLLAVLGLAGCALWPASPENGPEPPEEVRVVVHNQNFYDATIYAHWNAERVRLGRVTGNTTEAFSLDYRLGGSVRFEVRLQAGPTFFTDDMAVPPGEEVIVEIPPHLDRIRR